jgi:hypothetical protein
VAGKPGRHPCAADPEARTVTIGTTGSVTRVAVAASIAPNSFPADGTPTFLSIRERAAGIRRDCARVSEVSSRASLSVMSA